MKIQQIIVIVGLVFSGLLVAETFTKKKQPKVTIEDCCHQILFGNKTSSRNDQYNGQIKGIILNWAEDFVEDEKTALLKVAPQEDLKECYRVLEKWNTIQERYEQDLREIRDELKQIEQKVSAVKSKK